MPSTRRVKVLGLTVALIVMSILYFTVKDPTSSNTVLGWADQEQSNARQANQQFYDRTVAAMEAKAKTKPAPAPESDQDVIRKLKEAGSAAKASVETQGPRTPPEIILEGGDSSVAGRKKMKGGEKWDISSGKESVLEEKEPVKKTDAEKDVDLELNSILKRSPSKCFHRSGS